MAELTQKQKQFCDEYLIDLNGTQAYQRVYGCKESTAKVNACKLLTNTNLAEYIQSKQKRLEIRTEWTAEEILKDIKSIAQNAQNETRDRLRAYELGGKHLGMFTDNVKLSGGTTNINIDADYDKFLANATEEEKRNGDKLSGAKVLEIINRAK